MRIDLSVKVTEKIFKKAAENEKLASFGHLGTHFDVMNKEFPLDFTRREAVVFDVRNVIGRDITESDINLKLIKKGMLVAFCTGFIEKIEYGSKEYYLKHPQLSDGLIDILMKAEVSLIGVDFAGVRRGNEHTPMDQYLADRGIFVIENLINLDRVLDGDTFKYFKADVFPVNFEGMTGLPCRVVAET